MYAYVCMFYKLGPWAGEKWEGATYVMPDWAGRMLSFIYWTSPEAYLFYFQNLDVLNVRATTVNAIIICPIRTFSQK